MFFLDCYGHVKPSSLRKTNSEGCWNVFQMAARQIHTMKDEARICSCPFPICMNLPPKVMNHWCVLTKSHTITRVSEKSWSWIRRNLELAPVEDATLPLEKTFGLIPGSARIANHQQNISLLGFLWVHKIRTAISFQFSQNSPICEMRTSGLLCSEVSS